RNRLKGLPSLLFCSQRCWASTRFSSQSQLKKLFSPGFSCQAARQPARKRAHQPDGGISDVDEFRKNSPPSFTSLHLRLESALRRNKQLRPAAIRLRISVGQRLMPAIIENGSPPSW